VKILVKSTTKSLLQQVPVVFTRMTARILQRVRILPFSGVARCPAATRSSTHKVLRQNDQLSRVVGWRERACSSSALLPKKDYYSQCYCVSSWFRLPDQGMDDYELLSRASCFLVAREGFEETGGVHIVTSAHVVHPFAFPNYYPLDQHAWLGFVGEEHVMTKFEIRSPSAPLRV
jgi:hypothetical protein